MTISSAPAVSIVLPTFEGARHLPAALRAIRAQNYGGEIEIVAIDSASRDDSVAILKSFGARVHLIAQSEFGHGATRNLGVRMARGEIIVFLSQDAVPVGPLWLQGLVDALQNPAVGAAFARQLPRPDATPLETFFHGTIYPRRPRTARPKAGREPKADAVFFSNVCSAARREVCARFPFDESLIMSEDQIFARDLLRAGLEIRYEARVEVVHSHAYALGTLLRRNFDSGHSMRAVQGEGLGRQMRRALRFVGAEIAFLGRGRHWRWLAFLPFYEAARFGGLLLGRLAPFLPRPMRVALSLHRSYWQNLAKNR